jgi:hypothetical protein
MDLMDHLYTKAKKLTCIRVPRESLQHLVISGQCKCVRKPERKEGEESVVKEPQLPPGTMSW